MFRVALASRLLPKNAQKLIRRRRQTQGRRQVCQEESILDGESPQRAFKSIQNENRLSQVRDDVVARLRGSAKCGPDRRDDLAGPTNLGVVAPPSNKSSDVSEHY